jgi:Ca2+/Na+ antiporter
MPGDKHDNIITFPATKLTSAALIPWSIVAGGLCLGVALLAQLAPWTDPVFRLLLGSAGVMLLIAAGTQAWIQRIDHQPDLDASGREQNRNAVLVASTFLGSILLGLLIICIATVSFFKNGTAIALFWGLGALLCGGFIGFLFSLPKVAENEKEPPKNSLQVNTSLNQIADWLTKIIVGVSLVNAKTAYQYFVRATLQLGAGIAGLTPQTGSLPAGQAFAAGLIVTFFFLGLLGTYLLTRLWISAALARADQAAFGVFTTAGVNERDLVILENEIRSFSERERTLSAAAEDVARRVATLDIGALRTWREFAAWAKAKSALGQHEEAILGYEQAVQLYPESPALRLEFAVALFLAAESLPDEKKAA